MNIDALKQSVPAAFRTTKQGAADNVSSKYQFIPTYKVIKDLEALGWEPYAGKQPKTFKKSPDTVKHMVRFRNKEYGAVGINGNVPEILMVNSHDCTSAFKFYVSIFRVISDTTLIATGKEIDDLRIRHMGYSFEAVRELINEVSKNIPEVFKTIKRFQDMELTTKEAKDFAMNSYALRYPQHINETNNKINRSSINGEMDIEQLLVSERLDDQKDTLWNICNRVQEHLVAGDYYRIGSDGKLKKARPLSNIRMNLIVNTGLWNLAEKYIK